MFTKEDLKDCSKEELVDIVLGLQEELSELETTFDDENEEDWEDLDDEEE